MSFIRMVKNSAGVYVKDAEYTGKEIALSVKSGQSKIANMLIGRSPGFALAGVMGLLIGFMVLGYLAVSIWPHIGDVSGNVAALSGTDNGTVVLKAFWVVATMIVGIAVGYSAIKGAMNEMQI